jgi:hypothetical protein
MQRAMACTSGSRRQALAQPSQASAQAWQAAMQSAKRGGTLGWLGAVFIGILQKAGTCFLVATQRRRVCRRGAARGGRSHPGQKFKKKMASSACGISTYSYI